MIIRISVDDGHQFDVRVAEQLDRAGLKGEFYIAPYYSQHGKPMSVKDIIEISKRHEIGGHTLSHCLLTDATKDVAKKEISEGKKVLEDIIGRKITKFSYPKGWFNANIKRWVKEAGFEEARTMKMGITNVEAWDKYEMPVTLHVYPQRVEKFGEMWARAKKEGYFHLVCHSWEIAKFDLENVFINILDELKNENQD